MFMKVVMRMWSLIGLICVSFDCIKEFNNFNWRVIGSVLKLLYKLYKFYD